eukprot:TRINITY_DN4083_c0_g1_i1.p1 TRINITY_DN4083_c0_g1~~TRINITY_DN4083_c0_g1_i1.p1  ORF type:complete len:131 (-),score=22.43 TRINITY_DN4083_c0_g1_i1:175-567(-)
MEMNVPGFIDTVPEGWYRGGSHPGLYWMGLDDNVYLRGTASAVIKSKDPGPLSEPTTSFGAFFQNFFPRQYLGKRVRLTANLKYSIPEDSFSWAALWMKIEYTQDNKVATLLDNMKDRRLVGTSAVCFSV